MASSRGSKQDRAAAAAKVARLQAEQRQQARRRTALVWGSTSLVLLLIAAVVTGVIIKGRANAPTLAGVQTYPAEQGHVETPVTYPQTPPVGGKHSATWLNCGIYDKPVPNENAVHALEHGAVWVTYDPKLSTADVATLRKLIPNTYAVLSPYAGLPAPVVASAWGKQLLLTGANDPRLPLFIKEYRQGPQTPEPGAACVGGMDGPGQVQE